MDVTRSRSVRWGLVGAALAMMALVPASSCRDIGGQAVLPPTTPTPADPDAPVWTYQGRVVTTLTGAPVPGAVIQPATGGAVVTDAAGGFAIQIASATDPIVTIRAPGTLERRTAFAGGRDRSDLTIDVIPTSPPFSLDFYRQLARNRFDAPNGPSRRIARWEAAPNFYIKTTDQAGADVDQARIDRTIAYIRHTVPQATAGHFEAGIIETGADPRAPEAGWVRVLYRSDEAFTACGTAFVGANPGEVNLRRRSSLVTGDDGGPTSARGLTPSSRPAENY